jgi:16S rRNA (guanine527-N7)-methyltransferase
MDAQIIFDYFPELSERQREQFRALDGLYRDWNAKINVISRKDIDNLYVHHVLHSLAIAKVIPFRAGTQVLDLGTGGGFPGIPLAILFPQVNFHLIDGTAKKIRVCQEVIEALELGNVSAKQQRAEEIRRPAYEFVVTRAVAKIDQLAQWSMRLISPKQRNALPNGILALKGKGLKDELATLPKRAYVEEYPIDRWFREPFFAEKEVMYLQY